MSGKRYIGDGVYAEVDDGALVLTTSDGIIATNRVVLEPDVWHALLKLVAAKNEAPQ